MKPNKFVFYSKTIQSLLIERQEISYSATKYDWVYTRKHVIVQTGLFT